MAIGWMCNELTQAFQTAGSDDPEGCSVQLLTLIWQGLCEPIWALRNDILHRNPNPRVLIEMTSLADQLQWFRMHKRSILAPHHYILAKYTSDDIKRWNRIQRCNQLRILNDAKQIYNIECTQGSRGQRVLTDIFPPRSNPTSNE